MKKISKSLVVLFMVSIGLTSCGNKEDQSKKSDDNKNSQSSTVEASNTTNEATAEIKKDVAANNVFTFKDMSCNDAACDCNACFYKFIGEDGKELVINEVDEKKMGIQLSKTIEHPDEGGYIEVVANKKYLNKKFEITYAVTKCKCDGLDPINDYKKLTSIKLVEQKL
ncbi:MAG: hypothetical protein ACKO6J_01365 [Crocinitomicaceae bacterium]